MLRSFTLIFILSIAFCATAVASPAAMPTDAPDSMPPRPTADRLMAAFSDQYSGLWEIAAQAYLNPAVNQWRMDKGITSVGASYSSARRKDNPDPRTGDADRYWEAGASTYTKYRSSTLWGHASYLNGVCRNVAWNETADAPLLYPYLLADSIGGDLKREQYSFSGGYADRRGRLAWGAAISYVALLQYRDVDPRPRNVVGRLSISIGGLYRCAGRYYAGVGFGFMKYKQTNEVEFKSEMGVDKVYHLTGLGSHYNRFAGDGLSTYYDGFRVHLDLNLYPSDSRGAFAACRLSRFSFENILSDLNRLPLARAWHNQLDAEAGWLSPSSAGEWGVAGNLSVWRRHGSENIFGDPAVSIYPVIGANEMYADNGVSLSASARWGLRFGPVSRFHILLSPEWSRRTSAYIEPYSYRVVNAAGLSARAAGDVKVGRSWLIDASASLKAQFPYSCMLSLDRSDAEMAGLQRAEQGAFLLDSSRSIATGVRVGALRTFAGKFAVALGAEWNATYWNSVASLSHYAINLNFIF